MTLSPEALYIQLGHHIAEMPDLGGVGPVSKDVYAWIGRAAALLDLYGYRSDADTLKNAAKNLGRAFHDKSVNEINATIYAVHARAELAAPLSVQGSFIPAGGTFDVFAAFSKVVGEAANKVMIIDPYADEKALTDFAVLVPENVEIQILADKEYVKPSLKPAYERWIDQHGSNRPLQVRLASKKTLHDRLIIVDDNRFWTIGQSLNAIVKRSPTSIVSVDSETSALKAAFYNDFWNSSTPI